jgi:hypothetical protein
MKKVVVLFLIFATLTGCNQSGSKQSANVAQTADPNAVNVTYFHGKQRCPTCTAVGDITQATIKQTFSGNEKVRFVDVDLTEKVNETLVKKYGIVGFGVVIAKGNDFSNITAPAAVNALGNPEVYVNLIISEVNKRL